MEIILNDGRSIYLARLHQCFTYAGLLAGLPSRSLNADVIQSATEEAQSYCLEGTTPFLIPPVVTPIEFRPPPKVYLEKTGHTAEGYEENWKKRQHERMPSITCTGVFDSGELKKDGSEPKSSMTFLWYQDKFALPIDPQVVDQIKGIDWEKNAKDWDW